MNDRSTQQITHELTGNLSAVRSLAARQHGRVRRPSARHGGSVDTSSFGPRRLVVGVVDVQPRVASWAGRRRVGESAEAVARDLSAIRSLAARELGAVAGRVAIDREAAESLGPSLRVLGMPLSVRGAGAPAVALEVASLTVGLDVLGGGGVASCHLAKDVANGRRLGRDEDGGVKSDGKELHLCFSIGSDGEYLGVLRSMQLAEVKKIMAMEMECDRCVFGGVGSRFSPVCHSCVESALGAGNNIR